jgi:antitoxin VapB
MPFSVKSDRADELLRELRELTGEGITEAVTRALDDRLTRTRVARLSLASDMMWHLEEFRRKYPEFATSNFRAEDLYDEHGLPR